MKDNLNNISTPAIHCDILKTRACMDLWRAVVDLAIRDALDLSQDNQAHHKSAINWITNGGSNFRMACEFSEYCPRYIQRKLKIMLEKHKKKGTYQ